MNWSQQGKKLPLSNKILSQSQNSSLKKLNKPKSLNVWIYTLELQQGKYYVGRSSDVESRFKSHCSEQGAQWCSRYKPIRILSQKKEQRRSDENSETYELMQKFGIENVRGGIYCQIELTSTERTQIEKTLKGMGDQCYFCGSKNHYVTECPKKKKEKQPSLEPTKKNKIESLNKETECSLSQNEMILSEMACFRCGRIGHFVSSCFAKTNIFGNVLDDSSESEEEEYIFFNYSQEAGCSRCGRSNHSVNNCFAKTNISGQILSSDEDSSESEEEEYYFFNYSQEAGCSRCGRSNHSVNNCFANSHISGGSLDDPFENKSQKSLKNSFRSFNSSSSSQGSTFSQNNSCTKCGRNGHSRSNCFAKTHLKGWKI